MPEPRIGKWRSRSRITGFLKIAGANFWLARTAFHDVRKRFAKKNLKINRFFRLLVFLDFCFYGTPNCPLKRNTDP